MLNKTMVNKIAPRVDRFPIEFLTLNYQLLKDEIVQLVQQFLSSTITLIPKVHPYKGKDYRPIACCTILYKIFLKC